MSDAESLLRDLRAKDARVSLDGDRLNINAPKGLLTAELRARLAAHGDALKELLRLERDVPQGAGTDLPRVQRTPRMSLSNAQQRLWFMRRMHPESTAYIIPVVFRWQGRVDLPALDQVLRQLVQRHESLRTHFFEEDGNPFSAIDETAPSILEHVVLPSDLPGDREAEAVRVLGEHVGRQFDLSRSPLVKAVLVSFGPDQHLFALVQDHIVSDGRSVSVLTQEFMRLYGTAITGGQVDLPALEFQYADYEAWQRHELASGAMERHLSYWKEKLAGLPAALPLPLDHRRPVAQTFHGARRGIWLPEPIDAGIRSLARGEGVTLFMALLGVFQIMLSRHAGVSDIPVGTVVANRNRAEAEPMVGLFVNNLVMRGDLSGDPTVRELLQRTRAMALEAYAHQEMPFDSLVEALNLPRQMALSPLFQILFVLHGAMASRVELPGAVLETLELPQVAARYDMSVDVFEFGGRLRIYFEYNTDLFRAETIDRLVDHYHRLLEEACARPDARISELRMLSAAEQEQLGGFERGVEEPEWPSGVFVEAFASKARERGQQEAVRCADRSLTYAQLDAESNRIAHALRGLGVGRGAKVGLCLERSERLVAALLGIQKSGAAYVPLDPGFPAERLQYMLTDSGASVLVTADGAASHIEVPAQVQMLDLTAQAADLKVQPDADPGIQIRPEDPAYVIYTSGSTGRPKGVTVPHGALLNFLRSMQREPGLGEQDVLAAVTTISFDIAGLELYLPLLVGARIELVSRQEAIDGQALAARLASSGATVLQATPATWRLLIESGWRGAPGFRALCGGEALPQQLAAELLERVGELWNLYGPTETTIWSTLEQVKAGEPITVGRPIANTQVYVLGPSLERMPVGSPGEIWIGGDGVALGYHDRPELTAERFVADPYSSTPGARLYRTGDLGRWTKQGRLEHLGRADGQVKIRGYRIELGEIEAVMERCEGVRQAAVVVRNAGTGNERLVGCVVMEQGISIIPDSVRARLSEVLPDYMVPRELLSLEFLPLTANGKVDRNALSQLVLASSPQERVTEEPETQEQKRLVDLWMQLLQLPKVGIHENFFDLGGHSLLVARLQAAIRREFGVELPLRLLFEQPTVAGLAKLIVGDAAQAAGSGNSRSALSARKGALHAVPRGPRMALSNSQSRLWFLRKMHPESSAYIIPLIFRWTGKVDARALDQALRELVLRHESLRTRFVEENGQPFCVIDSTVSAVLEEVRLSAQDPVERESEAMRLIGKHLEQPFDLSRSPLMKAVLFTLDEEQHLFALVLDHIIADGASVALLMQELSGAYAAAVQGRESGFVQLQYQYADYEAWQRHELANGGLDHHLAYWKRHLANMAPVLPLPLDFRRPPEQTFNGQVKTIGLSESLAVALRNLGRSEAATPFMVLLAIFQTLLGRHAGVADVPVGTVVANRNLAEAEAMVGFFVNNLVMRGDLSGDPTVKELLQRTRTMALEAYAHQEMPFDSLVEALNLPRQMATPPLFQVLFVLHGPVSAKFVFPGANLESVELLTMPARYDLTVDVYEADGRLRIYFEYNTDLFRPETIDQLMDHYHRLLEEACARPGARISELRMLSAAELEQLGGCEHGAKEPEWPSGVFVEAFASKARERGQQEAVRCADRSLTYAQLDAESNRIAHALRGLGVGRGAKVGLCLERSERLVAALLGIQKSGAAYVPLDPGFPAERLQYMLTDSGASVLVTADGAASHIEVPAQVQMLDLTAQAADLKVQPDADPGIQIRPEDPAYVIYTSGSTGRPKGVTVPHGALLNFLRSMQREPGLGEQDVLAAVTTISFDIAGLELYLPLLVGARIELVSRQEAIDGQALAARLASSGATVLQATPATWRLLIESGWRGAPGFRALCGGEALPQQLAADLLERVGELWNLYGPTETTIWSTLEQVKAGEPITVGRPIANTQVYVLGPSLERMPVGSPGEIWIGGDGVALGYHDRPELTAERFVADPYSSTPGARLYRTGDLGRWTKQGRLEHLGRADGQVKIRGYRIELGEIEAVMERCEGVRQAAVVVRNAGTGNERLVGCVVMEGGAQEVLARLRARLREALPEYMVPQELLELEALPLTANGKIDRKVITANVAQVAAPARPPSGPLSQAQQRVAALWKEVLDVTEVGSDDNFFDLGGHSLLLARLQAAIRREFGVELAMVELFQHTTVAAQAERLEPKQAASRVNPALARARARAARQSGV